MCWVVNITLVGMVKFKCLAHFPVDHLAHPAVSSFVLLLCQFAAFACYMIDSFISVTALSTFAILLRLIYPLYDMIGSSSSSSSSYYYYYYYYYYDNNYYYFYYTPYEFFSLPLASDFNWSLSDRTFPRVSRIPQIIVAELSNGLLLWFTFFLLLF